MKAFVTGGTGFVGSHLVAALTARGATVTCLVRDQAKAHSVLGPLAPQLITGDLSNAAELERGAAGADVVFHVAGLTAGRSRAELHDVNAGATARVAAAVFASRGREGRMVYVSSLAAAGPSTVDRARVETDAPQPVTPYGDSKLAGEEAVRSSGVDWTIVRPPAVYGPRDAELLRVFKLARTGLVPVFGDGSQRLSLIYVEDLANALIAGASPEARRKLYFAAGPDVVSSRELVSAIHRAVTAKRRSSLGIRAPLIIPIPPAIGRPVLWLTGSAARLAGQASVLSADKADEFFAEAWTCSSAAIEHDTGWRATFDVPAGLARTVAWYRENGWL